jgi:hypothetical protein
VIGIVPVTRGGLRRCCPASRRLRFRSPAPGWLARRPVLRSPAAQPRLTTAEPATRCDPGCIIGAGFVHPCNFFVGRNVFGKSFRIYPRLRRVEDVTALGHFADELSRNRIGFGIVVDVGVEPVHHVEPRIGEQFFQGLALESLVHFRLHERAEVRLERQRCDWRKLRFGRGSRQRRGRRCRDTRGRMRRLGNSTSDRRRRLDNSANDRRRRGFSRRPCGIELAPRPSLQ